MNLAGSESNLHPLSCGNTTQKVVLVTSKLDKNHICYKMGIYIADITVK